MAEAERWAAGIAGPAYAIDDETAIKVVDGTVEVVSEGHWRLFTPEDREPQRQERRGAGADEAVAVPLGHVVVRHHRNDLHRDAAHRAADRRPGLGCARRCADRAERRGRHRSCEPPDREVTAVEPSAVMRAQRPAGAARCVAASAESLPFEDQSFDAAMAFATVHHWQDPIAGLREMQRVARRVVVFTCDTTDRSWRRRFWLTRDYLPEVPASASASLPSWPVRSKPGWSRCSFRGIAPTASSRPTGAGPRRTWTRTSVAEYRCGPQSGRTPSRGQCAASAMISPPADGPNATATSSTSRQQSSACAC